MIWTVEAVAKLRALAASGAKSGEIAKAFGATRGTVMGKLHRLDVHLQGDVPANMPRRCAAQRPKVVAPKLALVVAPPPLDERLGAGPAHAALLAHHCRWPVGSPEAEDFHFCSERRVGADPYCAKHLAAAGRVLA